MKNMVHTLTPIIAAGLAIFLLNPLSLAAPAKQNIVELVSPDTPEPIVTKPIITQREVYGPITPSDTLWAIASRYRPSNDVTVHQVTVAIYKLNPHAFKGGNINAIISGGAIRIPSEQDIKKTSHKEAVKLLSSQSKSPKKKTVASRSDGKRVVKFYPKGPTSEQASSVIKRKNSEIENYKAHIATLEKELAIASKQAGKGAEISSVALIAEQEKVQHLTELNHSLKMRNQAVDEELTALKSGSEQVTAQINELKKQLALKVSPQQAAPAQGVDAAAEADSLYTQLVSNPLNLLMMVVVYTLLLLVIIVVVLRIKAKKALDEQEKDLAESPMGVMAEDESEFDSLLSDELDTAELTESLDKPASVTEIDEFASLEESLENEETTELGFPELTEELPDLETSELAEPEAIDEYPENIEAETEITEEVELEDLASEPAELSELDKIEDAPDLVPAPDLESVSAQDEAAEEIDIDLELGLDLSSTEPEVALETEVTAEPEPSDEVAPLDFPIKSEPEPVMEVTEGAETELNLDTEPSVELDIAELDTALPESSEVKDKEFVDIETLMEGADDEASESDPYDTPSLDVGLEDFPDLVSDHGDVDVDADTSGVNTQLDLARAYLEIDDKSGAKAILDEVMSKGNESQVAEANALLEKIGE